MIVLPRAPLATAFGAVRAVSNLCTTLERGAYGDWYPTDTTDMLTRAAREKVDELIAKVGCKAEVHVCSADPIRYVPETAHEAYGDVLVIGRSPDLLSLA